MNESELELEEVYKWLDGIHLSRPKRNIARDFSDGVLMAELLKQFYPRLVECHNYSPANSYTSKLNNWVTLNKKVLNKLDLSITQESITAIASSTPGSIEELLKNVKKTIESRSERIVHGTNAHLSFFARTSDTPDFIDCKNDPEIWQKHAMMLSDDLAKAKRQLEEKDDVIEVLQKKVAHLESLLELKDLRLIDMTKQLQRYQDQSTSK